MACPVYGLNFVPDLNTRVAMFEEKLTEEQLQYLRHYYEMNKNAGHIQIRRIAKQWNIDDFDFFTDLINWFFDQQLLDIDRQRRRLLLPRIGG